LDGASPETVTPSARETNSDAKNMRVFMVFTFLRRRNDHRGLTTIG
jgi:hypothetical protein